MKTLKTNYLGKRYLEQCPKITIKTLFKKIEKELKKEMLNISLDWIEIIHTRANYGWYRSWFKCPKCQNKIFTLYNLNWELMCRKCSNLTYKKQRYKWMIEWKMQN